MILAVDFETSALPLWSKASDHPDQPHIVQAAMMLVDLETHEVHDSYQTIVRPDGWEIPPESEAIHGISTARALAEGIAEGHVVDAYRLFHAKADGWLGYSVAFDQRIIRIALFRAGLSRETIELMEKKPSIDVMQLCTPLCRLTPSDKMMASGRRRYKTPRLEEASDIILGRPLIGAHNAMTDLTTTLALYWKIKTGELLL